MFEDKVLICKECGKEFTFTAGEQEFYAEKGLQEPKYCKECRDARKAQRKAERTYYTTVCARCGNEASIPFPPKEGLDYYCSSCFEIIKAERETQEN